MKKTLILNGPNLNLIGARETSIYGDISLEDFLSKQKESFHFDVFQSNIEGVLIDKIQSAEKENYDYIVLNAGGYTHTSVAIRDAIGAVKTPVIEVHISNIFNREDFRSKSLLAAKCIGHISGFGLDSYSIALRYISSL